MCGHGISGLVVGLELSGDHDPDTWVYLDATHTHCLAEWDIEIDEAGTLHHRHFE